MFTFHFKNNLNKNFDIQGPTHKGIPSESPVYIFYTENEDLSRHEILKRFFSILINLNIRLLV